MSNNMPVIDQTQLANAMTACVSIDQPLMIWGPPGVGKSESVAQLCANVDGELVDIRLSQYESVDLRGLPDVDTADQTVWRVPSSIPFEGTSFPDDRPVILFLDEVMHANASVLSVAFQLVLDRRVGEHKLKSNVRIILASNRETDRGGVGKMPTPLANRLSHVELLPAFEPWKAWAYDHGIHPMVTGFLSKQPQQLDGFDAALKSGAKAFPTPRTWKKVSDWVEALKHDPVLAETMVNATVGEAAGAAFNAFLRIGHKLPDVDDIIKDPQKAKVPEESDVLHAVVSMLVAYMDNQRAQPFAQYARRLPLEYQTVFVADVSRSRAHLLVACSELMQMQTDLHDSIYAR